MLRISILNRSLDYTFSATRIEQQQQQQQQEKDEEEEEDFIVGDSDENSGSLGRILYSSSSIPVAVCVRAIFSSAVVPYLLSQKQHDLRALAVLSLSPTFGFTRDVKDITCASLDDQQHAAGSLKPVDFLVQRVLARLFQLRSISICFLDGESMEPVLRALSSSESMQRTLEELTLESCFDSPDSVAQLASLHGLISLTLNACEVSTSAMRTLLLVVETDADGGEQKHHPRFKRLQHLKLRYIENLDSSVLTAVCSCEYSAQLISLDVQDCASFDDGAAESVAQCWRLEELNTISVGIPSSLGEMARLRVLRSDQLSGDVLESMAALPSLEVLDSGGFSEFTCFRNKRSNLGITPLARATCLREVNLRRCDPSIEDYSPLAASASSLEILLLSFTNISPASLSHVMNRISSSPGGSKLYELDIGSCEQLDSTTPQWLPAVSRVKSLRTLIMHTLNLTWSSEALFESCMQNLAGSLETLDVHIMSIDGQEAEEEAAGGEKSSSLNSAPILRIIGSALVNLTALDVSQNKTVDERRLRSLEKMPNLRSLQFGDCDPALITEGFFARIADLPKAECFPALGILRGTHDGTKESVAALRRLKWARPQLGMSVLASSDAVVLDDPEDQYEDDDEPGYNYDDDE